MTTNCNRYQCGFSLVELITVMIIIGIIGAIAAPRFLGRDIFNSRGYYDQLISTVRYAQKAAIAQHRFVCVTITASNVSLAYGTTSACADGSLINPANGAAYSINAPGGITATAANFSFNSLGQPSFSGAPLSITVSGYTSPITVETETGYVH
jgi:MSHA pilin protein MshC